MEAKDVKAIASTVVGFLHAIEPSFTIFFCFLITLIVYRVVS
jgi:hypothetical protein